MIKIMFNIIDKRTWEGDLPPISRELELSIERSAFVGFHRYSEAISPEMEARLSRERLQALRGIKE